MTSSAIRVFSVDMMMDLQMGSKLYLTNCSVHVLYLKSTIWYFCDATGNKQGRENMFMRVRENREGLRGLPCWIHRYENILWSLSKENSRKACKMMKIEWGSFAAELFPKFVLKIALSPIMLVVYIFYYRHKAQNFWGMGCSRLDQLQYATGT